MRGLKIVIFIVALFIAFVIGTSSAEAFELKRAYFRIPESSAFSLIRPYLHHDFGEGVFSIEAPGIVITALSKNSLLEFRGEATLWQLSFHQNTQASCSPSASIPWGVTKVNGGSGGGGIKVAVIDTGVYKDHPDLKANIVGCVDAQTSSLRSRCPDGNGHGTHVAGTIAANGKIKGVAPAASIIAVKVCSDRGSCWSDDVARGIKYAADNGANVISISLGGSSMTTDEKNQINYAESKGALVVAAAGNSGPNDNTIGYPAAYYKVLAVGATDSSNAIASWSSRGNNYLTSAYLVEERDIELVAPGVGVESTSKNGCYTTYSGTSMATPHVSGLSAKLWQGSASSTRTYLQNLAKNYLDLGRPGDDPDAGFGLPIAP